MSPQNILFSFRRCPYAMRARMALYVSGESVIIEEIELKKKPVALLAASEKATVPVLILKDGTVLEESLEIMQMCLHKNDPKNWLVNIYESLDLINKNDIEFKPFLDFYKYSDRFPERNVDYDRAQAEIFLSELEKRLESSPFLISSHPTLADIAVFPFVRQFAMVDILWFKTSPYVRLNQWLEHLIAQGFFKTIMVKDLKRIN